jgi:hypothetical protein
MNRFFQPAITAVLLSAALVVIAVTLLSGSVAQGAATYIKTDGTIVDPIMDNWYSTHLYSGNDLEPFANLYNANLANADLTNANLFNANLFYADLSYANLANANLANANLTSAVLTNASLYGAALTNADLGNADLFNANLSGANLFKANLTNADLGNAYLNNAYLYNADLYNADLDNATFSPGTTLYDGQTVLQHGFDAAGLQAYLEASPVNASYADIILLVPEPHTLLLASLASLGLTLRRRGSPG